MLTALLDHLWQSTLVALLVGLLVIALRKAPAAVRHGLWFAASLKFLIPFAALAALGRLMAPSLRLPVAAPERTLIETAAQPFTQASLSRFPFTHAAVLQAPASPLPTIPSPPEPPVHAALHFDLAAILLAVWALGFSAVLIRWAIRLGRVLKVLRAARPLDWPAPVPVLASPTLLEPGLVGFLRPVLAVPESLPEHLTRSQIDAILAHEICHLRRRDNLTAAIHMLVEAVFWFHPLVWWIGTRLIAERERACDEAVIEAGHDRAVYARGLVESCRLYVQSPLSCVAGASGPNLKTRVEAIMTAPATSPLSRSAKALLLAAGACAFATPVAAGLLTTPEGQKAVARAVAAASRAAPALIAPANAQTGESQPTEPVVLARNEAVLAPALSVTKVDAASTPLSQDIAAPRIAPPPSAAAAQPFQVALAAPAQAPPSTATAARPAPLAANPADAKTLAADFVKSYADATPFRTIGRWASGLCVHVTGLSSAQEEAVRARVAEVANSLGRIVWNAECRQYNVEIGFTEDAQGLLDSVKNHKPNPLGDRTSDTLDVKTVTLPIQAWYVTNGVLYAQNDRRQTNDVDGLKVNVLYQDPGGIAGFPNSAGASPGIGGSAGSARPTGRAFTNVLVIVDLRKTGNANLAALTDYAAMLVLSQPRALGRCNVLPSITDLFASCPGRPAPDGLTPADTAYLTALYTAKGAMIGSSHETHVIDRMADLLVDPHAADHDLDDARQLARGKRQGELADGTASAPQCGPVEVNSFGRHDGAPTPSC